MSEEASFPYFDPADDEWRWSSDPDEGAEDEEPSDVCKCGHERRYHRRDPDQPTECICGGCDCFEEASP